METISVIIAVGIVGIVAGILFKINKKVNGVAENVDQLLEYKEYFSREFDNGFKKRIKKVPANKREI